MADRVTEKEALYEVLIASRKVAAELVLVSEGQAVEGRFLERLSALAEYNRAIRKLETLIQQEAAWRSDDGIG